MVCYVCFIELTNILSFNFICFNKRNSFFLHNWLPFSKALSARWRALKYIYLQSRSFSSKNSKYVNIIPLNKLTTCYLFTLSKLSLNDQLRFVKNQLRKVLVKLQKSDYRCGISCVFFLHQFLQVFFQLFLKFRNFCIWQEILLRWKVW